MFHPQACKSALAMFVIAALGVSLAGCGRSAAPSKRANQSRQAARPVSLDTAKLPQLGSYLPPLDDGRVEVAPPADWYIPPRSSKYLFMVRQSDSETYPCVLATVEDFDGFAYLSEKNVGQFAKRRASELGKQPDQVKPVRIGDLIGITYAKRAKVKGTVSKIVELQYLETVVDGRLYRLQLRAESGTLQKAQPYLYAIAAGLRFPKAERPAPDQIAQAEQSVAESPTGTTEDIGQASKQTGTATSPESAQRSTKATGPQGVKPETPPTSGKKQEKPKSEQQKPAKKDAGLDLDELEELLGED